jgi:hypothetical protein
MKYKDPNNLAEEEQIKFVQSDNDWGNIKYINNPSEAVQLAAVKRDPFSIYWINATEKVQLAAIDISPSCIAFIKNQTEKTKLKAIERIPACIRDIDNPSEEMQLIAIRRLISDYSWGAIIDNIKCFTSPKAKELIDKTRNAINIIK